MKALIAAVGCALLFLQGCTHEMPEEYYASGYLTKYHQMTRAEFENGEVAYRWLSPYVDFSQYNKVIIDPVIIFPPPVSIPAEARHTLKQVTDYLDQSLAREVSSVYPVTDTPGDNVLRLKVAITRVTVSKEKLAAYEYIPIALLVAGAVTAVGERDQAVEVFLEVNVEESVSGITVAQAVKKGLGTPLENRRTPLTLESTLVTLDDWVQDGKSFFEQIKR